MKTLTVEQFDELTEQMAVVNVENLAGDEDGEYKWECGSVTLAKDGVEVEFQWITNNEEADVQHNVTFSETKIRGAIVIDDNGNQVDPLFHGNLLENQKWQSAVIDVLVYEYDI